MLSDVQIRIRYCKPGLRSLAVSLGQERRRCSVLVIAPEYAA